LRVDITANCSYDEAVLRCAPPRHQWGGCLSLLTEVNEVVAADTNAADPAIFFLSVSSDIWQQQQADNFVSFRDAKNVSFWATEP